MEVISDGEDELHNARLMTVFDKLNLMVSHSSMSHSTVQYICYVIVFSYDYIYMYVFFV